MNMYPTEYRYQKEIIKYLSTHEFNGLKYTYLKENQYQYDRQRCIISSETLKYIEDTQPQTYKKIIGLGKDPEVFISNLIDKEIKKRESRHTKKQADHQKTDATQPVEDLVLKSLVVNK